MKKTIHLLAITFFILSIFFILHNYSIKENLNIKKFERRINQSKIKQINSYDLNTKSEKLIDVNSKYVFYSNEDLTKIIRLDLENKKAIEKNVDFIVINSNIIDSLIYCFDGNSNTLITLNQSLKNIKKTKIKVPFVRALALNNKEIILRQSVNNYSQTIFSIYNLTNHEAKKIKTQTNDSTEVDGSLKTDGVFNKYKNNILYTQYRKGSIYKLNIEEKRISYFQTIDSITDFEGVVKINGNFTLSKPVLDVNLFTTLDERGLILNASNVLSDTDSFREFRKKRIIDVYDLQNGTYKYSFYLNSGDNEKARDFKYYEKKLYVLFKNKIVIYELQ